MIPRLPTLVALVLLGWTAPTAGGARPDVDRWPSNDRMVLIQNEFEQKRPLDGRNAIKGGTGEDYIVARFSRGTIDCGPGRDIVFVSKKSRRATKFKRCETITRRKLR